MRFPLLLLCGGQSPALQLICRLRKGLWKVVNGCGRPPSRQIIGRNTFGSLPQICSSPIWNSSPWASIALMVFQAVVLVAGPNLNLLAGEATLLVFPQVLSLFVDCLGGATQGRDFEIQLTVALRLAAIAMADPVAGIKVLLHQQAGGGDPLAGSQIG